MSRIRPRKALVALTALACLCLFVLWRKPSVATEAKAGNTPTAQALPNTPAASGVAVAAATPAPAQPTPTAGATPLRLLGISSELRSPPSAPPVADKWARARSIAQADSASSNDPSLRLRIRLVETDFKHPLLRIEEAIRINATTGSETLVSQVAMVADHVLLKPAPGVSERALLSQLSALGGTVRSRKPASNLYLVTIPAPLEPNGLPAALDELKALSGVVSIAEPDYIVHALFAPNDPNYGTLWGLHNTSQTGGTADADIDAPEAWDISTGSRSVVVGIIDTGIDHTHPDLAANMWTNPREIAGNGVDDDGNGYVDDTRGWDFVNNDNDPSDDHYHGTHCAGTIGAVGDNGVGLVGVAHEVSMVALKFLSADGGGTTSDAVEAVAYATGLGFDLTSNSWGGGGYSQALHDAISAAGTAGQLFIAAAGNNSTNTDAAIHYPSGYELDNIVSVAATDNVDALASFSNYGVTSVDLGAPGAGIYSTSPGASYRTLSGTSMATPHVAGAAAVLLGHAPSLTAPALKALLLATVDTKPALVGKTVSGGRLNLHAALLGLQNLLVSPASGWTASGPVGGPFSATSIVYTFTNLDSVPHAWSAQSDVPWITLDATSGTVPAGGTATFTATLAVPAAQQLAPGSYSGAVTITDITGNSQHVRTSTLLVTPPAVYTFNLDTDPGWPRTGQWAYGQPAGLGGGNYGNPDPTSGHTGTMVLGVNLNGNYSTAFGGPYTVTAGPFNLAGYAATRLQFRRWLNSDFESWVSSRVEISTNGTTWSQLWSNGNTLVADNAWQLQDFDISNRADNQPAVYIRWVYQVVGTSNVWPLSGWNIDDIAILGAPPRAISIDPLPPTTEDAGALTATLRVQPAPAEPLVVQFTSSDPALVPTPADISLAAGATSASVPLTVLDNTLLDGTRTVRITPVLAGHFATPLSLAVQDNETATLSLLLPESGTEGGPAASGSVLVSSAPASPVVVSLSASPADAAVPPATVTIPAGSTQATFSISFPENLRIEGPRVATLSATVPGWTAGSAPITVEDNDARVLSLALSAGLAEGRGLVVQGGTITLSGTLPSPLVVSLASSDDTQLSVPPTVTIPAGTTSAKFDLNLPEDTAQDGVQTVTVSATADTFSPGSAEVQVADNDPASFAFATVASPQYSGQAFTATITALDIDGAPASGFVGVAALSGAIAGQSAPMSPAQTGAFSGGAWTGSITCQAAGENWTLHAATGAASGVSNAFAVRVPVVQTITLPNNDIVYDPGTNRIYASTPDGTLVPIDPASGALGTPITVSTTAATHLARASDGSRLWVAHDGSKQIRQISLPDLAWETNFAVGSDSFWGTYSTEDILAMPGEPTTLAVARVRGASPRHAGVTIFDNGVPRAVSSHDHSGSNSIEAGASPGRIFGSTTETSGYEFRHLQTSPSGVVETMERRKMGGSILSADGDLVVGNNGRVMNGETVGLLASLPYSGPVRPDVNAKRVYVLSDQGGGVRRLRAYDTERFSQVGSADVSGVSGTPAQLIRVGAGGLAFRTPTQIFLLNTVLVPTPDSANLQVTQLATPNPAVAGQPLGYLVSVRNLGGGTAESVSLVNTFPTGAIPGEIVASQGTATASSTQITVALGTLAAGAEATLRFKITPASTGTATNTAQANSTTGDPDTANNQSTLGVNVAAAPGVSLRRAVIGARDLAYHAATDRLLVSLSNTAPVFGNALLQVDPVAFAPLATRHLGDNPGRINLTADEQYAYVILDGSFGISRVPLSSTFGEPLNFPVDQINSVYGLQRAGDIATIPGRPTVVAARLKSVSSTGGHGVGLFENGVLQPKVYNGVYTSSSLIASADGAKLYGYEYDFTRLAVQSDGLTLLTNVTSPAFSNTQRYKRLGAHLYTTSGKVFDPETLTLVADLGFSGPIEPSLDDDRIYILDGSTLRTFDLQTRAPAGTLALGTLDGTPANLVRCGGRSIAFVTSTGVLYLLDTPALVPPPPLRVVLPARLTEGVGTVPGVGRVEILRPAEADIAVTLNSSAPDVLDVTRTLVIPAGATSAPFSIEVTDNSGLNGTRAVIVSASTPATYTPKAATVRVDDDETGALALELPDLLIEGAGSIADSATVRLSAPAIAPLSVELASSDATELQAPLAVTIPAGADSVTFALTLPDDDLLDGPQTATLTASVPGYTSASAAVQVVDNESRSLAVSFSTAGTEGNYVYATLTLPGKTVAPLSVSFASSDLTELSTPSPVTIATGQSSASVYCYLPDDTLRDGAQNATLTASAAGFTSGSAVLSVRDNDPASATWSTIPSPQVAGVSFNATVTLRAIDGEVTQGYSGYLTVGATNATGSALLQNAPVSLYVSNGVGTGSFAMRTAGAQTRLQVQLDGLDPFRSDPFTVNPGSAASFAFSPLANPQVTASPVTINLAAVDAFGNTATSFTGTAALSLTGGARSVGSGSASSAFPMHPYHDEDRTQVIYLASELGGAGTLNGIALNVLTTPGNLQLKNWTVRVKHTTLAQFSTPAWESTGWTIVHQGNPVVSSTGWLAFPFSVPFAYDGSSNLMVDFSVSATGHPGANATVAATTVTGNRMLNAYGHGEYGSPIGWTGSSPYPSAYSTIPNVRFSMPAAGGAHSPSAAGPFVDGLWSGPVTFLQPGANLALQATSNSVTGASNAFDIRLASPVLSAEPAVTGGTLNTVAWTPPAFLSGTQVTETQASATADFAAALTGPWTSAAEHTFDPLSEGLWHFRARTRLTVPFVETWTQTSQADFALGTFTNTTAALSPGNVTLALDGSSFVASGTHVSAPLQPGNRQSWGRLWHNASRPASTTLTVDVLDGVGALLAANVASGTDLSTLPALSLQSSLRLRANLSTGNTAFSPSLQDWSIEWVTTTPPAVFDSDWSPVATSIQDATPPTLTVTSSLLVGDPAYTLAGTAADANGVVALTINTLPATTPGGYADWSRLLSLQPGENVLTLLVSDSAVPPNTRTQTVTVTYQIPDDDADGLPDAWENAHNLDPALPSGADGRLGDPDTDGLPNLVEYAFGLDPRSADSLPFSVSVATHPETGAPHLAVSYRRLIAPGSLTYTLQTSSDLSTWTDPASPPELLGTSPNADGLTETVFVRVNPALGVAPAFVRIQITTP